MGREMGGRFKREGACLYLWLIHVEVWQKTTKLCKAITLQLKYNYIKKFFWLYLVASLVVQMVKNLPAT